jgi:hypothetical protein
MIYTISTGKGRFLTENSEYSRYGKQTLQNLMESSLFFFRRQFVCSSGFGAER